MSRYAALLIVAIYVVSCASLSTELKFVSESDVTSPNYAEDEVEEGETDDNDIYENVTFTVKKSASTAYEQREVEYETYLVAFKKKFILVLRERPRPNDTFSFRDASGAKITVTGSLTKRKSHRHFNPAAEHYVSGYLRNEPSSIFHGKYNNVSGVLEGVIRTAEGTYHLTPTHPQRNLTNLRLSDKPSSQTNFQEVVHRVRYVRLLASRKVQTSSHKNDSAVKRKVRKSTRNIVNGDNVEARQHTEFGRIARQISPVYKVCELTAVIHPSFYNKMCHGSVTKTIEIVRLAVTEADRNFRRVDFNCDNVADNIGFVIKEIIIYTNDSLKDYRIGDYGTDSAATLYAFAEFDFRKTCVAVLFTYHVFENRIVGLAFKGHSSYHAAPGGMCQIRKYVDKKLVSLNVLFVSALDSTGPLRLKNIALTLTHELGHAFGSPHDKETKCMPGGIYGMYLMHPTNMETDKDHSDKFSKCSLLKMGPVVHKKGWCLRVYDAGKYCGNSIREPEEECDCGRNPEQCHSIDSCCVPPSIQDPGCRIQRELGYVCSPVASPCCTDLCQVTSEARECRPATECAQAAMCDAVNVECPEPVPLADGTPCAGGVRVCFGGLCVGSTCEHYGWVDCQCAGVEEELCQLCCTAKGHSQSDCKPAYKRNDTDDLVAPVFLKIRAMCRAQSGYCDGEHKCLASYPKDDENILGQIVQESSGELSKFLQRYWYFIALTVCLLIIGIFVVIHYRETTISKMSYQSSLMVSIWFILGTKYLALSDQLSYLESHYYRHLRGLERKRKVDLVTGTARLSIFFPTVSRSKIVSVLNRSNCEEFAVRRLIMDGYPMKRDLFHRSLLSISFVRTNKRAC